MNSKTATAGDLRAARMAPAPSSGAAGKFSSLRQALAYSRREKEEGEKEGAGGKVVGELLKKISAQILNFLWELTGSVVGFIPGFLALNLIAFLQITGMNLFGVVDKIKFRLGDKMGLLLLDFVAIIILFGVSSLLVMIITWMGASWWEKLLISYQALTKLGWATLSGLIDLF